MRIKVFLLILLISYVSLISKSYACDVCNIFEYKTIQQTNYLGIFYHYRSFNGYNHLNQSHNIFRGNQKMHELDGSGLLFENKQQDFEKYNTLALRANFKIAGKLRANVILPFEKTTIYYNKVWSVVEPVSDTAMVLNGLGDAIIAFDYNLKMKRNNYNHLFVPGIGIKLPTGAFNIADPQGNAFDREIQPGSGTLDLIFRLNHTILNTKWGLTSSANYKINGRRDGYQFGNSVNLQSDIFLILGSGLNKSIPKIGLYFESAERNRSNGEVENLTGGHVLMADVGYEYRFNRKNSVQIIGQFPLMENRNGNQIGNAGRINLALVRNLK